MRSYLAGLVILLILSSRAMAQVSGNVESVGIEGQIRPDCWMPMRISLTSHITDPKNYQLQVWQEDLDKDHVVYTKEVTLSGKSTQKFEMYFVFQPRVDKDPLPPSITTGDLQRILKVRVCLPPGPGKKPSEATVIVERLGIKLQGTSGITQQVGLSNLDPPSGGMSHDLGCRLVLWVTDRGSSASPVFRYETAMGMVESIVPTKIYPENLGESVLFYDAVDAVIWMSADSNALPTAGSHRLEALQQFVRQGGKLVVCQTADLTITDALAPMLPVETKDAAGTRLIDIDDQKDRFVDQRAARNDAPPIDALPWLAENRGNSTYYHPKWHQISNRIFPTAISCWPWSKPVLGSYPIRMAHARQLKPGAVVNTWQEWSKDQNREHWPFIVRGPYGLGSVTWVAQDLGDFNITRPEADNWPHVWDHVLDWSNDTLTHADLPTDANSPVIGQEEFKRKSESFVDFSKWMNRGTNYGAKGAAYIFFTVLFFILYWLAAGPGTYLYLRRKKRKELNWFLFGAWAFVGLLLTVLLVRLLLRGDPEARHLTVVRQVAGEPTYIYSRVGLYIPRDGDQAIALDETSSEAPSYITPLQIHSDYVEPTEFPAAQEYAIPLHDEAEHISLRIPFRSTAKKLQMRWVGKSKSAIAGSAQLTSAGGSGIAGQLVNQSGTDLKNIYIVYNYPFSTDSHVDMVLFIPKWQKDQAIDLSAELQKALEIGDAFEESADHPTPRFDRKGDNIRGRMNGQWDNYWTLIWGGNSITSGTEGRDEADFDTEFPNVFPILSLFDRIAPARNRLTDKSILRVDFLRRGGRILNMSSAVAAGKLVVLAQSANDEQPVPFPLMVEGSRIAGQGRVLYQLALPLDRGAVEKAASRQSQ